MPAVKSKVVKHTGASRGGPLCIGRPRIDGEGSMAGSSPEGKDGGKSCQTSPRTSGGGSRSHQQAAICFGFVGTRQSRCRTFEGFSEEGSRAVTCSTIGRTLGFLSPIHRTCERTRVSCRGQDPRSPGRQAVGRISIGPGSARSCEDEGGGKSDEPPPEQVLRCHPNEELQRLRVQVAKLEVEIARHRPSRGLSVPSADLIPMDGVSEPVSEMQRVRAEITALTGGQNVTHLDGCADSFRPHGSRDRCRRCETQACVDNTPQ